MIQWCNQLDEKVTSSGFFFHFRGRVYDSYSCLQGSYLVKETMFKCRVQIGCSKFFLAKNLTFHAKIKHIGVEYHFVRDMIEDDKVKLEK